jgi:hypothetical protein
MKLKKPKRQKTKNKMIYQSEEMYHEILNISKSSKFPIKTFNLKVDKVIDVFQTHILKSIKPSMISITSMIKYTDTVAVLNNNLTFEDSKCDNQWSIFSCLLNSKLKTEIIIPMPYWIIEILNTSGIYKIRYKNSFLE